MPLLRLVGRGFLAVIALGACAIGFAYARTEYLTRHRVELPRIAALSAVPEDSISVARGAHLANAVAGCTHCHGIDLGGDTIIDEPLVMRLTAPNLTTGRGGVIARYDDAALDAAIRHGVAPDGRVLRFMPSHEFAGLADDHLAAIIAFVRSRPPVNRDVAPITLGPLSRVLSTFGGLQLFPYYAINHAQRAPARAPTGPTHEHGEYLAQGCVGCHGQNLSGGPIPGAPPEWPAGANLTPGGIGLWTETDFLRAMRTGIRPDGTAISTVMPWKQLGKMTDDELLAIKRYLASVPPRAKGSR